MNQQRRPRLKPLLQSCARMAGFCGMCAGLAGLSWAYEARSEVAESSLEFGRQLVGLGALQGRVSHLRVNGNDVLAGGHYIDMELELVLERFKNECSEASWHLGEQSGPRGESLPASMPLTLTSTVSETEGAVVCVTPGRSGMGLSDFLVRAGQAVETGELGHLGQIHYLYAKRHEDGGTHVVGVWTAAKFNIHAFFGRDSEENGDDSIEVPRIPGSHRTLHVELVGSAYAVRSYATEKSPVEANAYYLSALPQRGWKVIPTGKHANADKLSTYEKDGAVVLVVASEAATHTQLSILEMGAAPHVTVEMRQP